jgi:hypothetical protein
MEIYERIEKLRWTLRVGKKWGENVNIWRKRNDFYGVRRKMFGMEEMKLLASV